MEILTAKFYRPSDSNFDEFINYLKNTFTGDEILIGLPIDKTGLSEDEIDRLSVLGYNLRSESGKFFSLTVKKAPPKGSPGAPGSLSDPQRID